MSSVAAKRKRESERHVAHEIVVLSVVAVLTVISILFIRWQDRTLSRAGAVEAEYHLSSMQLSGAVISQLQRIESETPKVRGSGSGAYDDFRLSSTLSEIRRDMKELVAIQEKFGSPSFEVVHEKARRQVQRACDLLELDDGVTERSRLRDLLKPPAGSLRQLASLHSLARDSLSVELESWRRRQGHLLIGFAVLTLLTGAVVVHGTFNDLRRSVARERAAVAQQRELESQVERTQHLESLGVLAGGIAHDFNNILHSIGGYAQLTRERVEQDRVAHEYLGLVEDACQRARLLVRQILVFSRHGTGDFRSTAVSDVVGEALALLRASLPATIQFRANLGQFPSTVQGDATQLHQVVMNLCTNAAHAMGESGGVLEVELKQVSRAQVDHLMLPGSAGEFVRLRIRDHGVGMSQQTLKRVYEPFFTTKGVGEGAGLGLSVVHGIINDHGGAIKIDSKPELGTTVCVYLPLESARDVQPRAAAPGEDEQGAGRSVLLVDDEAGIAELGKRALSGKGFRVTAKTDSLEALEVFRADPTAFDAVVTDLTMPRMNGRELAGEIRSLQPTLPILIVSGYGETMEKIGVDGCTAVMSKPIKFSDLAAAINRLCDSSPVPDRAPRQTSSPSAPSS